MKIESSEAVSNDEMMNSEFGNVELPVLSIVATQAISLIESGDATAGKLEDVIRVDPSLTVRILQLANSPMFSGRVTTSSISQAVVRLGINRLKTTLLIAATSEVFDLKDPCVRALWEHALAVAVVSHWLSTRLAIAQPDECFVSGLLHDVGKAIMYQQAPKPYAAMMEESASKGQRFYVYEKAFCSHAKIGGMLASKWGLSEDISDAIRLHHEIEENVKVFRGSNPIIPLISTANLIANQLGFGCDSHSGIDVLESIPAQILGLTNEIWEHCCTETPELLAQQQASLS